MAKKKYLSYNNNTYNLCVFWAIEIFIFECVPSFLAIII